MSPTMTRLTIAIVGCFFCHAALSQIPQNLPQNQMGAATVVLGQILLFSWIGGVTAPEIEVLDDKSAHLRGVLPGKGRMLSDIYVVKGDDCRFVAVIPPSTMLAMVDLTELSAEYRQGEGYGNITVLGTGKRPALCYGKGCRPNLTLGFAGDTGYFFDPDSAWRALKAVQFLQQYCPPKKLGF